MSVPESSKKFDRNNRMIIIRNYKCPLDQLLTIDRRRILAKSISAALSMLHTYVKMLSCRIFSYIRPKLNQFLLVHINQQNITIVITSKCSVCLQVLYGEIFVPSPSVWPVAVLGPSPLLGLPPHLSH